MMPYPLPTIPDPSQIGTPKVSGPIEPSTPWGPYPWEHQPQPARPSTPWGPYPWEQNPAAPPMPGATTPGATPPSSSGGVGPMPDWQQFLIWIGALVVLWFALTALAESGFAREANAIAGLILAGALLFMGPQAMQNAQKLTQPRQG